MTMRWLWISVLAVPLMVACGGKNGNKGTTSPQCSDGIDNDHDGMVDFPDDPGCTSPDDNSEDSAPAPQCSDGRDNDGDGKIDYPNDPGCIAPEQNDEKDDCPDGPSCPQCSNGKDDDSNGLTDFPNDQGCTSAADPTEFTLNAGACGPGLMVTELPTTLQEMGTFDPTHTFGQISPCGGGGSMIVAEAYALHLSVPKVIIASTSGSSIDTVLDIRSKDCTMTSSEIACNNDVSATDTSSSVTTSLDAGDYYILVESPSGNAGAFQLDVQELAGEGSPCATAADCGPGLVCRVPMGGSSMVCSKPECSDGVDDDADGKLDYPDDPGCSDPSDNDETDDCPDGPTCPECSNGKDDDGDGLTDYPTDPSCKSAGGNSEACNTSEGVTTITTGMTSGDTTGATDDYAPTCASSTGGTDLTYELDLPPTTSLSVDVEDPSFTYFPAAALLGASCNAPEVACEEFGTLTAGPLAGGTYFVVVDGDGAGNSGTFTITVSGTIAGGGSCDGPLAQAGALTCAQGYTCMGAAGSKTCTPAACHDGIDNDGDGKIDYPNDPGCASQFDDDETDPATPPVCSNGMDDDSDGKTDFPTDFGCSSAAGTSEVFCSTETDPVATITAPTTSGTLASLHADLTLDCGFATANDKTYSLQLPVPVQALTIDTTGSTISDTAIELWDAQCTSPGMGCNDDFGGSFLSSITVPDLAAGNYAVTVKGYSDTDNGAFKLNVKGTLGSGTPCTSSLFTAGVLTCATGLTCGGTPKTCH